MPDGGWVGEVGTVELDAGGHPVRAVTRSGTGDVPAGVEFPDDGAADRAADAEDGVQCRSAWNGAPLLVLWRIPEG